MVISSPCLIDNKELTSPEQTAPGKDFSNPLIVDSLLKTIWSSMHHVFTMKHWLVQSKRLLVNTKFLNSLPPERINQQTHLAKFPQIDSGLAVPVFKQGDDPIDVINKMMSFLSTVVSSRQQRVVKYFNCQWEGHMARQCPKPKRKRDATWFRDKVLLVEVEGSGKVLNEEELEFLADPRVAEVKVVLMANLSSYGSDALSEEKELILLMFKAADLEISMHGDYYELFVTDPKR
ncbi:retrovirus-related pol polyprotein from transposon TNT 1-94 [Tanacetum coccineum]